MNRDFVIKIGGAINPSVRKSFDTATKELNKLSSEMSQIKKRKNSLKQVRSESSKLEKQFSKSREEYQKNTKEAKILSEKIESLRKQVNGTSKSSKAATIEFRKALKVQEQLNKKLIKSKEATKKYGEELNKTKSKVWMLEKGEKALNQRMEKNLKLQEKLRKRQNSFNNFEENGKKRMRKSLSPALMIGAGVKLAIDDEAAFADVKKQINISNPKEIQKFRNELLRTTKDIPLLNNEIYEIAAAAGQAGIAQNELSLFTSDTAKVAVAFGVDANKAGSNLATWRTSLKMTQDEVMGLADQINTLGDNIKVTPDQVSDIVTAMGPLGRMANITVSQTAALGASLIDLGTKDASTASTALRKLYSTMTSGDSASKSRKEAFQTLGFDASQIAKDMQKDSIGTIKKVLAAFKNVDESKRLSIGTMLFGEEAVGALLPLVNQLDKLQSNLDLINDKKKVTNSVNNEFNNVNSTASAKLKVLVKSLLNLGLAFTNFLLPPIKVLTNWFTSGAQKLNSFAEKFPGLVEFLTLTTTALVGTNLAIGAASFSIGVLGKAFTALAANPIPALLIAIAVAGYMVYEHFDAIKAKIDELWNKAKNKFTSMKESVVELWKTFEKSPIFKIFKYTPLGLFINGIKKLYTWYSKFKEEKQNSQNPSITGMNITKVPKYGRGGVVNTPHLAIVGDSHESIIPHDKSKRSQSLWYDTGVSMGMFSKNNFTTLGDKVEGNILKKESKININIDAPFKPIIHGKEKSTENLQNLFVEYKANLEEVVRKVLNDLGRDKERMSFE